MLKAMRKEEKMRNCCVLDVNATKLISYLMRKKSFSFFSQTMMTKRVKRSKQQRETIFKKFYFTYKKKFEEISSLLWWSSSLIYENFFALISLQPTKWYINPINLLESLQNLNILVINFHICICFVENIEKFFWNSTRLKPVNWV